ncbi:type II secretion system protein [Ideonella azotifigens]|uniref:Type II secretion system protein n=1 Tax=Ideonella azotifigens TaxID=513160 RepID=A0ABP3VY23_9BURK|nr:type II secretion system protein [Ideonella azotifigens]MCD2345010.1 type II secretion system protein [Ideonella azotifigens]
MRPGDPRKARQPQSLRVAQQGMGWVFVLLLLAVASTAASLVAQRWADQIARENERQLLRVGDAYAAALARYRASTPGGDARFPGSLEDLLTDRRAAVVRRHLRALYPDPLTGQADWALLRDARGDISGVRSRSDKKPWAQVPQQLEFSDLPAATHYSDWVFTPRLSS